MTVCTREALAHILHQAQQARAERVILTIGRPLAAEINRERLIGMLDMLLPLCQGRTQAIRRARDGSWYLNLRLHYRAGLCMADAWASGDLSALSDTERQTMGRAEELAQSACGMPQVQQISTLMAALHACAVYENPPQGTIAHGSVVNALSVLYHGRANCQGFSDAFYLLCTLAGLKAEYRLGFKGREMHLWNGVEVQGHWLAADATAGKFGTEVELGLRRAEYGIF